MTELDPAVVLDMAAGAPDGLVIVDREGLIRYWNRGAERIFGYSAEEVAGRSLDLIIPEKHRERHGDGFVTAMQRGVSRYGEADLLSVPAVGADGRRLSIEFSVVLLPGPDGAAAHCGAVVRDVTARRAREKARMRRETAGDEPAGAAPPG